MAVDYGSLPFAEALEFFRQKLNLPTAKWDDLLGAAHDRAFVVAGATMADLLADLRAAVDKAISQGTTYQTFKKDFEKIVAERGWTGWTGEGSKGGRAWRARVIYETNLYTSYSAGRFQQMKEVANSRPYWRYRHSDAVTTPRPEHAAWNGKILRHDDPWWAAHAPPNGFGCKCYVETLAARDLKKLGIEPPKANAGEKMPFNGTVKQINKKTGEVIELPEGVDKGWDYQPGANRTTPLYDLIARKLPNLDAPLGAAMWDALKDAVAMEMQQAWWNTLDEWLTSPQKGRAAVVGTVDRATLNWLKQEKSIAPQSAAIDIQEGLVRGAKQQRHLADQDGLSENEWRRLPEILAKPEAIYFDTRTGKLVYVVSAGGDAGIKLSVEFDARVNKGDRTNRVVSGFRQSRKIIDELVRGGLYKPLP